MVTRNSRAVGFESSPRGGVRAMLANRAATICRSFGIAVGLVAAGSTALYAQVPAVVATSPTTLASGFSAGPAVLDACGNVYVYEGGGTGVVQINAATGKVTVVAANAQGYPSSGQALYMDPNKTFLYFPDFGNFYTTHFDQLPIVNCTPGTVNTTFANNLGNLGNYYWGTAQDVAGDAAGDVFFITTSNVTQAIYKEAFATGGTYTDSQIFTWTNTIKFIASDAAGDIFFVDANTQNVYSLPVTNGTYATTPTILVPASTFGGITGLSVDPASNLYVADGTANLVFEVPNEGGKLNGAHVFATASVGAPFRVAVDNSHNLYLSNYYPGAVKLSTGSTVAANTAVGSTSPSSTLTYVFNSAQTIKSTAGLGSASPFSVATGSTCVAGQAQAALSTCTVNVAFKPTAATRQAGALLLTTSSSTLLSNVAGVGVGPEVTIDPGTVTASSTAFSAPSGVTTDSSGNVYVTDTTANTVTELVGGIGGKAQVLSTGKLTLSKPQGVAVDALGNVFIADTGNNRIVEIPAAITGLPLTAPFALVSTLMAPQALAVDALGNLAIANTGANNVLLIPNINGSLNVAQMQTIGSGFGAPAGMTFDLNGNLYLADTGNGNIYQFPAPVGGPLPVKLFSSLSTPIGLATDTSGSLFVVENGTGSIDRYPLIGGNFGAKALIASTILNPVGVAIDANGNLYATDTTNDLAAEVTRVTAAMPFGNVNIGSVGTQTSTFNSSGNASVVFPTADYTVKPNAAPGFAITKDTCSAGTFLPGSACSVTGTYSPTAVQINAEQDVAFTANNLNGTPLLQMIGSGIHLTPTTLTLVLTSPANTPVLAAGQAVTFTATIGTGTQTASPIGSVKFFVNGAQVSTAKVSNGTAVLTLKNGLPAGSPVVLAQYGGDSVNFYSPSQAQLTESVTALPDTLALTVTPPYNNPLSANDNAANAAGPAIPFLLTITTAGAITPSGTVTFFAGSSNLGTVSVNPIAGGGYGAALTTTALRAGTTNPGENGSFSSTYSITATYSGDNAYAGGTTPAQTITIVGANPAVNPNNTTGATFTITPTNPTLTISSTSAGGQTSSSAALTVLSYGGWYGVLNFTCAGLPAYATCSFFPGAPQINASTPGVTIPPTQVAFTITTNVPPATATGSSVPLLTGGIFGILLLLMRVRLGKSGKPGSTRLLTWTGSVALLVVSTLGVSSCSSSKSPYVTPAGTSHVTIAVKGAQLTAPPPPAVLTTQAPDVNVPAINVTLVVQ